MAIEYAASAEAMLNEMRVTGLRLEWKKSKGIDMEVVVVVVSKA